MRGRTLNRRLKECFTVRVRLGGAALVLIGAAAAAAPDARALFQDGEKALHAGDELRAIADFEAAYAAQPAPSLLYWLGEAHFQAGHSARAEDLFRKYLKAMPAGPKAAEAKARLEELQPAPKAAPAKKTKMMLGEIEVKRKRKAMQMEEVKLARVAAKKKPTTSPPRPRTTCRSTPSGTRRAAATRPSPPSARARQSSRSASRSGSSPRGNSWYKRAMLQRLLTGREGRPLRFLIVGGFNTLFGIGLYAALYALTRPWHLHYLWVAVIGNLIAVTVAYVLYKIFVFRTRGGWLREYAKFWASYAVIIGAQFAGLALCVSVLHIQPVIANVVVVAVSVALSWLLHNYITFRRAPAASPPR